MRRTVHVRLLTGVWVSSSARSGGGMIAQGPQQDARRRRAINQTDDPLLKRFVWRSIGPVAMGGRIDDVAVVESDPSTFYIGLRDRRHLEDGEQRHDVRAGIRRTTRCRPSATSRSRPSDRNIIYVGTGEPNNRQSSSFGGGVFKSTDGGKKFTFVGLKETQTIAKIAVHPKDPEHVYVAAPGTCSVPIAERGIYKTTDGGKTWTHVKFIDNDTGFIDMVMHPTDPNVIWAASYQRRRAAVGVQRRRSGEWDLAHGRRRENLDEGLRQRPAGQSHHRTHRSGHLPVKPNVILAQIEVGPSGGAGAGVNEDGSLVQPGSGPRGRWRRRRRWRRPRPAAATRSEGERCLAIRGRREEAGGS